MGETMRNTLVLKAWLFAKCPPLFKFWIVRIVPLDVDLPRERADTEFERHPSLLGCLIGANQNPRPSASCTFYLDPKLRFRGADCCPKNGQQNDQYLFDQ